MKKLRDYLNECGTQSIVEYRLFENGTIKEAHEGIELKMIELRSILEAKGYKGPFTAVAGLALASIFEIRSQTGNLAGYCGNMKVFKDAKMPDDCVIIANLDDPDPKHYGSLKIEGFIV